MKTIPFFLAILLCLCACLPEHLQPEENPALALPRLSAGPQIGIIQGFNGDNPPAIQDTIENRMAEARTAGMKIARVQVDWADLEPQPREYDFADLRAALEENQALGLETMLTLSTYDSDDLTIPEDLKSEAIDSEATLDRLFALLDQMVPILSQHGVWLMTIANEPDTHFEENPDLWRNLRNMLIAVRDYSHELDPDLAISMTFTEGGFHQDVRGIRELVKECDLACFNYYGQNILGEADDMETVRRDIRDMLRAFPDQELVLQELGCSVGYAQNSRMVGASVENQRLFFETVFSLMNTEDRFRASYVFQMVDWSSATANIYRDPLLDAGLDEDFVLMYLESLETLGLVDFQTGESRASWSEFLKWLTFFDR